MNERLIEIAKEAMVEHCVSHVRLEKFAELIVRECGVALNPMLRDMVSRGQAFDLIKKHFGVE